MRLCDEAVTLWTDVTQVVSNKGTSHKWRILRNRLKRPLEKEGSSLWRFKVRVQKLSLYWDLSSHQGDVGVISINI